MKLERLFMEVYENFMILRSKKLPTNSANDLLWPILNDVDEKLKQLWILYEEMEDSFLKLHNDLKNNFKTQEIERDKEWLRLKAKTEAIYYLAHRIKKILNKELSGFKSFNPIGIRNVRNHYFEHPKKNYSTDKHISSIGPVFGIWVYKKFNDQWIRSNPEYSAKIYPDLKEFLIKLNAKIKNELLESYSHS